jgi:hypothetical protein
MTPHAPLQHFSTLPDRPSGSQEANNQSLGAKINEASASQEQVHPRDKDVLNKYLRIKKIGYLLHRKPHDRSGLKPGKEIYPRF